MGSPTAVDHKTRGRRPPRSRSRDSHRLVFSGVQCNRAQVPLRPQPGIRVAASRCQANAMPNLHQTPRRHEVVRDSNSPIATSAEMTSRNPSRKRDGDNASNADAGQRAPQAGWMVRGTCQESDRARGRGPIDGGLRHPKAPTCRHRGISPGFPRPLCLVGNGV